MVTDRYGATCTFVLGILASTFGLRAVWAAPPAVTPDYAKDRVTAARLIATSPMNIKPCASVTAILEVDLTSAMPEEEWRGLLGQLSRIVLINGQSHLNLRTDSSRLNEVAWFEHIQLQPSESRNVALHKTYQFAVTFFINTKTRTCVFFEPGEYSIELLRDYSPVQIDVHVEDVTSEEAAAVQKLADLKVLLFLANPEDRQYATPEVLDLLEGLMRRSALHSRMLSMAVGIGRLETDEFRSMPPDQMKTELERIYGILNEHCNAPVISELDELAAYHCGLVANTLARWEESEPRADALRGRRDELWNRVRQSYGLSKTARIVRAHGAP